MRRSWRSGIFPHRVKETLLDAQVFFWVMTFLGAAIPEFAEILPCENDIVLGFSDDLNSAYREHEHANNVRSKRGVAPESCE